ncbi:17525_t:CDS:2, partial [Gigaspora margarita]
QKLYLQYASKLAVVPISNSRVDGLISYKENNSYNKSEDTFDKFDYEKDEFNEKKIFAQGLENLECTNATIYSINADNTALIKQ